MHTGYHILLLLVITVLIVILDQYVRSREDGNNEMFEGFDGNLPLLSGGSVNNSHKTAFICDDGYCKNSGGGNGSCIDVGAVSPIPTCTTINKHYIVSGDDGSIINKAKIACGKDNYSLHPLSGKPMCKYDEATQRCQPTQYYPSDPKQPDCHSQSPLQPSTSGGHHTKKCKYGPSGPEGANYCNLRSNYNKCVQMVTADKTTGVTRGTNGPIKCTDPSDEDCIHTVDQCKNPYDETPAGFGCYGSDYSSPFEAPLKQLGSNNNVCQYNPQ